MRAWWLILLASLSWGQCPQVGIPTLYRIQGFVVDTGENPLPGVVVEIYTTKSDGAVDALAFTATTDKKGRFSVKSKEGMQYEIRVKHGDKQFRGVRAISGGPLLRRSPGFQHLLLMLAEGDCPALSLAP